MSTKRPYILKQRLLFVELGFPQIKIKYVQYNTIHTIQYNTIQYIQYNTIQYIQYNTIKSSTIQCMAS